MWQNLPIIVARAIEKQIAKAQGTDRFVDVHRTTVFTSSRASTYQASPRAQMFKDMETANFEVHMARTTGTQVAPPQHTACVYTAENEMAIS